MATDAVTTLPSLKPPADRVMSVDVLRGFDMFWIIGGGEIVRVLDAYSGTPILNFLATQLKHCEWRGFRFEDLIFPLFVFMVGMSVVFSVGKIVEREGKTGAYRRIFRRFALMFALGIFYYGGISRGIEGIRIMGVLQRLALCYLFTALLYVHLKPKYLVAVCVALLAGYWAWLSFIPVPGLGRTSFEVGENWANYIDNTWLPLHKNDGTWDPEGILSTIPAVATCLLGCFAGLFIKNPNVPAARKALYCIAAGGVLVVAGYLWGLQFPVIKKIWTSSYVLVAGGYSCLLLGVFYQVVDVWKIRAWTPPFLWIGSNALAIYMARNLIDFRKIAERFMLGGSSEAAGGGAAFVVAAVSLGLMLLLAGFMYRKKVFIRI